MKRFLFLLACLAAAMCAHGQSIPATLPAVKWHLTGRPFVPINASRQELLTRVDQIVHALATLQHNDAGNSADPMNGAIIDPYNAAEWQYATPYFTFALATDLAAGNARDLIQQAVLAMNRATLEVSTGSVPERHGEFVVAPIMKALRLFEAMHAAGQYPQYITPAAIATWRSRMTTPRTTFMNMGVLQNWRTYASKGEWLRQQDGLISDGVAWIESNWLTSSGGNQRARFRRDVDQYSISPSFLIYHDDTSTPETFPYNAAAAGNLLDMLIHGYNGSSAADMLQTTGYNIQSDLLYMGGSGEAPAGGRSGDHVWNDVVDGYDFEMMAEISNSNGNTYAAGQYRHAAELAFRSAERFQQEFGWFAVTKNLFHPSLKVHYASYSALTNYNGYTEIHMSEAYANWRHNIPEQPAPSEIGGYAVQLDRSYMTNFLDAGGMQLQIANQGTSDDINSGVLWHTLGFERISRTGWDSRLGPADCFVNLDFSAGVSFCPTFLETGTWKNLCTMPTRYTGTFTPAFVHPLLIRGTLTLAPVSGSSGPAFAMNITLTPDGALVDTAETSGSSQFGVVWPVLEYDGRTMLSHTTTSLIASTAYPLVNGTFTAIQSEAGVLSGGATITDIYPNYDGTGFLDFPLNGGKVTWSGVDGGAGGSTTIGFRYALGISATGTRTDALTVNGVTSNITFGSTGTWGDWHQLYLPVTLTSGTANTISLQSTGQDGPNLDELRVYPAIASPVENDQQNYIALKSTHTISDAAAPVRGGYGDLRGLRVTDSANATVQTFVYPRSAGDPSAETVRSSFVRSGTGDYTCALGRVVGTLYYGRYSAGGLGNALDLKNDGNKELTLSATCNFIARLSGTNITAIEADAPVTASLGGRTVNLLPYTPVVLGKQ